MIQNKYFKLYGNCVPVKGYTESIICDLERCCYLPITNNLFNVLLNCEDKGFSIDELKSYYNNQYNQGIDGLFKYINEKGYGFYTNDPELFPKISLEWDSPYILTNAVVETDSKSLVITKNTLNQLMRISPQAIELRLYDYIPISEVSELLQILETGKTQCVYIYLSYSNKISFEEIATLYFKHNQIGQLIIHSAPTNSVFEDLLPQHFKGKILQITKIISKDTEDIIHLNNMVLNMPAFTEAFNFNLGLNRKVSIGVNGNIKNYLSHSKIFGNVQNGKIEEILKKSEFQETWKITKDQVEICKDCQYRYMCVDNSEIIYLNGTFKRKNDCNFNPYDNCWRKQIS